MSVSTIQVLIKNSLEGRGYALTWSSSTFNIDMLEILPCIQEPIYISICA